MSWPVAAILFALTFVLGIPTATYWTVKQFPLPIVATAGFAMLVSAGVVEPFGGPLGLPWIVAVGLAGVLGVTWGFAFVTISANAWWSALSEAGVIDRLRGRDGGQPD